MSYSCFAVAAPGLEPFVADELRALRITPTAVSSEGVAFEAQARGLYAANLWLRVASRVVVRLGQFHAEAFHELERNARRLPFERFIGPDTRIAVRATCRKSRLFHSDGVADRIAGAIARRTGASIVTRSPGSAGVGSTTAPDSVLVVARLFRDTCTVSVDSSGELLHRRGYREATAKAPMRETLAAATLLASGWNLRSPLIDPFCGSGTIPIEAALMARHMAPGRNRPFAFMRWPAFEPHVWDEVRAAAASGERSAQGPIMGSDRDAGATAAALANAARAGVDGDVAFATLALSAIDPPSTPGWLVTNPPYGIRVGDRDALRNLYAQLGNVARERLTGWHLAMLAADDGVDDALIRATRLPFERGVRTTNGGIPVSIRAILL